MTCESFSLSVALFPQAAPVSPVRNIDSLPTLCYPQWTRSPIVCFASTLCNAPILYDDLSVLV